ncbi:MAG: RluA family pseudouridine synthase [Clostridiales bacterium]|nr:RluA family pseudouridine synthase [Clostridiales bacterium]
MVQKVVSLTKQLDLIVEDEEVGQRLDHYLSCKLSQYSRNCLQTLIKQGKVSLNSKPVKANHRVKLGDRINVEIPKPERLEILPEKIELDIIYEDADIAVVNKPQGMVVHPAVGNYSGTLVNALLYHCGELSSINGKVRPGIVHRIDKDTSGILVVAKNDFAHLNLSKQIQDRAISRIYLAITEDNIKTDEGIISAPISRNPSDRKKMSVVNGGRQAVTHYKVLERFGNFTYLKLALETGRTHQIRVHLNHIGHPIIGDPVYGRRNQKFNLKGQALHAYKLILVHPRTEEKMAFEAPLPDYFHNVLTILRNITKNA